MMIKRDFIIMSNYYAILFLLDEMTHCVNDSMTIRLKCFITWCQKITKIRKWGTLHTRRKEGVDIVLRQIGRYAVSIRDHIVTINSLIFLEELLFYIILSVASFTGVDG